MTKKITLGPGAKCCAQGSCDVCAPDDLVTFESADEVLAWLAEDDETEEDDE